MKKLVGGNWKMNCTLETFKETKDISVSRDCCVDVFIAVPYPYISQFSKYMNECIKIGAQNVSKFDSGAYTGEVGAKMLAEYGVSYVLVGHSERRQIFSETSNDINTKLKCALRHGLRPVLCVGEPENERIAGSHIDFIRKQFGESVVGLENTSIDVAYEPIWAIGSGKTAQLPEIEEALQLIRKLMLESKISGRVIYGGSVTAVNARDLSKANGCDGFLVGNASCNKDFQKIIDAAS